MRIIQSFWSCYQPDVLRFQAGWLSPEYNWMSWSLSCLQLKSFYPEVNLYTDSRGAKILIDELQLPYDSVDCSLDNVNLYHPHLWALPKIDTYGRQKSPFLHVDGDVFIWEPFGVQLLSGELITQNEEAATDYYKNIMMLLVKELNYFPEEIIEEQRLEHPIHAYNAGIMGGSDIEFFKHYVVKAFQFVERNLSALSRINVSDFNIFFEQYLFYCLAKKKNKHVSVLIKQIIEDNRYRGMGDFMEVPYAKKYLHLIGNYKRNESVCDQLANRLRQDYPEHYYRILSLYNRKRISPWKDYYWFEPDFFEKDPLQRHNQLMKSFLEGLPTITTLTTVQSTHSSKIDRQSSSFPFDSIAELLADKGLDSTQLRRNELMLDFSQFKNTLESILTDRFSRIPRTLLLYRDIKSTSYSEYVFADALNVFDKVIMSESFIEIIESQYDWVIMNSQGSTQYNLQSIILREASICYTLLTPECHKEGYALENIDQLDCLIIQMLATPISIRDLFEQLESVFDPEELQTSAAEFEKLIFGRIKKGFLNKSIRPIIRNAPQHNGT